MKRIFVVVVNYNGREVLSHCLRSVFLSEYKETQVVVVDNASKDGSIASVRARFPKAKYIFLEENIGFAGGVNVGIKYALEHGADFVFLLNNDAIVAPDTLSILVRYANQNPRAVFSPYIYQKDNKNLWFCGGNICFWRMRATHTPCQNTQTPFETEYLSGCALFIPKKAFFDVGLFDEEYFLYYEDADWSFRARVAGYELWMIPPSRVIHLEQSEKHNPLKTYFLVHSGLLFFEKNAPQWMRLWGKFFLRIRSIKNTFYRYFHFGNPKDVDAVYYAYRDISHHTPLRYYRSLRK